MGVRSGVVAAVQDVARACGSVRVIEACVDPATARDGRMLAGDRLDPVQMGGGVELPRDLGGDRCC